ncbi:hypothetical protein SAMN05216207_103619 [Pseudonocardia ammonioxydans]|uniref:Uncharacterized protein n=2 Tax=Pseudonocardia ammonioxydans TaxID=260086 RepID=A0A1I5F8X2_PSUAM|nr:hypothetical protein SAMN05216207_103619 [Pseudonocardia ammonioxydans]
MDGEATRFMAVKIVQQNTPRLRICERCWTTVAEGSVCRIFRHTDPGAPTDAPVFSYRHLDGDPACTGAQVPEDENEQGRAA